MSLRILLSLLFTLILFTLIYLSTSAQQTPALAENVVRIETSHCQHPPHMRVQTGFYVKDKGIVTALHGIVDCDGNIIVITDNTTQFLHLNMMQVDIERDVALLTPTLSTNGVTIAPILPKANESLHVEGYPKNLTYSLPTTGLVVSKIAPLNEFLSEEIATSFTDRNSPNPDIEVIGIQGYLLPGHSGAPIFNQANQVVGVGNGGLESGHDGIGWAIPWHDIEWKPAVAEELNLAKLRINNPEQLFSFSSPNIKEYTESAYCLSTIETHYDRITDLKNALLIEAKKNAVEGLVDGLTNDYNNDKTKRDEILAISADFIKGTDVYTNNPTGELASVCVNFVGFLTPNDRLKLELQDVEGQYCDKNLPVKELQKQAIMEALKKYEPRLEDNPDPSFLLKEVTPSHGKSDPTYCITVNGKIRPVEVMWFFNHNTPLPTPTSVATSVTILPTNTPIPPTSTPSVGYPCDATVKGDEGTQIKTRGDSNGSGIGLFVSVGQSVKVVNKKNSFYRINDVKNNPLGWIPSEYLTLSSNCPQ